MTKKNISIRFFLFLALAGLLTMILGCGQKIPQGKYTEEEMLNLPLANRYDLPAPTGGMTLSIGPETLTADDILSIPQLQEALAPLAKRGNMTLYEEQAISWIRGAVRSRVADMLLYEEARKNAPENIDDMLNNAVKKEVERFVAGYDNNLALAEQELKKMGMDWRSFQNFQKKMIMTQSYISASMEEQKTFSRQELLDYYNQIKDKQFSRPGKVQFQLIELVPDKIPPDLIQQDETPRQAARRLADEIIDNLRQGQDFGELARQYSHGPLAALGGLWAPVTIGSDSLAEPYDILEEHAQTMSPGALKGPIENAGRLFILRLESLTPAVSKTFEEVKPMLEAQLEFQYKNKQYNEMVDRVIKRADLVEMERFAEFCAREGYRRWSTL